MPDNDTKKAILDFQKDIHQLVWSFALKREGQFVSYLAQVALAITAVALALFYGKYLLLAQVFALVILAWGAAIAVVLNYDYRINQALAWAVRKKFCAFKDIIPEKFGKPKGDLIWLHKIHLITFLIISLLIILTRFTCGDFENPIPYILSCEDWIKLLISFIVWLILFFLILWLICYRKSKFNSLFIPDWQGRIHPLLPECSGDKEKSNQENQGK
jgi:hypothetical protein